MRRRKPKRNYGAIAVSIFLALLMVTSIAGFIFSGGHGGATSSTDHGITFVYNGLQYRGVIDGTPYLFTYLPSDLSFVDLPDLDYSQFLQVDFTSHPNSTAKTEIAQAIYDLSTILNNKNVFNRQGFIMNNSFNLPIITCEQATSFVPVIYYTLGNNTEVRAENNCIIIEAESVHSFQTQSEALAYKILGVT